jgi:hypothetical protein
MIRWKYLFFMTFVAAMLAACASPSGPPFVLQPVVPDQTTIYAFRIASIVGGGNSYLTAVNDKFIGRLDSGTYAVYVTEPGRKVVSMRAGSIFFGEGEELGWGLGAFVGAVDGYVEMLEFDTEPGKIYFVQIPDGDLIPNDEALQMMDRLENVTPEAK